MLRNILCLLLLVSWNSFPVIGQNGIITNLRKDKPGQGKVRIFQDPVIETLLQSTKIETLEAGEQKVIKTSGYRIQIYAGNNTRTARNKATEMGEEVSKLFPELDVYNSFLSPRWICRVGDFRSIEEADAMLRKLRATNKFKEVSIVREMILIPIN